MEPEFMWLKSGLGIHIGRTEVEARPPQRRGYGALRAGSPNGWRKTGERTLKSSQGSKRSDGNGRAFDHMLSRLGRGSKLDSFERMKHVIYELSPDRQEWDERTEEQVYLLMQEISADLDGSASARRSLGFLSTLLSKGGRPAAEMARPIFYDKVRAMYSKPKYRNEPYLPRILLILSGYDAHQLENVTKEAIHAWEEEQFRAARGFLSPSELQRNGLRNAIKDLLGDEIAQAGNTLDREALTRALELYLQVK